MILVKIPSTQHIFDGWTELAIKIVVLLYTTIVTKKVKNPLNFGEIKSQAHVVLCDNLINKFVPRSISEKSEKQLASAWLLI